MADQINLQGIGAAVGAAVGRAVMIAERVDVVVPDVDQPAEVFKAAATAVAGDLGSLATEAEARGQEEAASVLQAQALMAEDTMLASTVEAKIGEGKNFNASIREAGSELQTMLASLPDPYLAARAADVGEVVERISCHLAGVPLRRLDSGGEPVIYLASTLTAAETAQMDPAAVLGFVTETGGPTSHVVIIARSMGVPAVVATGEGSMSGTNLAEGDMVVLDGGSGEVVLRPSKDVLADFNGRVEDHRAAVAAAEAYRGQAIMFGDASVSVAANVANQADLDQAIEAQADGIGLLRTEFLFLDRPAAPSEEEQYEFYAAAAKAFDKPVVIRTMDIGGDKPADYMTIPDEENPFLGVRGARLYHHHPKAFEDQVRAILRAAVHGDVWMMIPMITTVAEIIDLRAWIERIAAATDAEIRMPKIGAMVEVPAIALSADALIEHVDFVSIGSNDLTQYTMAADRTNEELGHLQDACAPSVMALCDMVAAAAKRGGVSASVCGLSAADPTAAAAYAAMGIDKLSVSARMVNPTKAAVASLDPALGRAAVDEAVKSASAEAVRSRLDRWRSDSASTKEP